MSELAPPYLSIEGLTRRLPGPEGASVTVVDDVSLRLRQGEVFALLGPSGCGKTSLLRLLAGLDAPDAGRVVLGGQDLAGLAPHERPVNMMFQSYALFPHLTVWDNIAFGLRRAGQPRAEVAERVSSLLRLVQLEPLARRKPSQLSGGQQQRVALARSLAREPRLLLLDEPLGALDRPLREATQAELLAIIRAVGVTCLMVTHDQQEAMAMADRIGVMHQGRLLQVGSPREVYERPTSRFVAGFIGEVNLMEGRVCTDESGALAVDCGVLQHRLDASAGSPPGLALTPGARVDVLVRPEHIHLARQVPAACAEAQVYRVHGTVRESVYMGRSTRYVLALDDGRQLQIRQGASLAAGQEALQPGEPAHAWWPVLASTVLPQA